MTLGLGSGLSRMWAVLTSAGVAVGLAACAGSAPLATGPTDPWGQGAIVGLAPLCYGPGADLNLHADVTIRAVRTDGAAHVIRVHISNRHHAYRMSLPVGIYTITSYSGHVTAIVRDHETTHGVDLPQPGCV
jgi:hypothetical protein